MLKIERQSKINELIHKYEINTQDELAERLKQAGFDVTQATISRDMKELNLTKVMTKDGNQKYGIMLKNDLDLTEKHIRIIKDCVTGLDYAQNMVILKTISGTAMAVAASIEYLDYEEVVGTIAGDDTIFCAVKTENDAIELIDKLNRKIRYYRRKYKNN